MNRILIAASVILFWTRALNGFCQAPSIREDRVFNTLSAEARTPDNPGIWKELIHNEGTSALVAFHATYDCGRKHGRGFYDHDPLFFYGNDTAIPPTGSFEIQAADPAECPGGIDAAIFSDGHTEGDPAEVDAIFERRRGIYEAIPVAIKLLQDIVANKQTRLQVQAALSDLEAAANKNHGLTGPERLAMRSLYRRMWMTLETNRGIMITPSDKVRRRLGYDKVAAEQNISMDQAQATVLVQKLEEWRGDLEGFLYPAPQK